MMKILYLLVTSFLFCSSYGSSIRSNVGGRNVAYIQDQDAPNYTVYDYVQEDLVSMLDAIDNVGIGEHDSSSHVWYNLVNSGTSIGNASMTFGDDYMLLGTTIYSWTLTASESEALGIGRDFTVEFLIEAGDSNWNVPFSLYGGDPKSQFVYFYPVPKRIWYHGNKIISNGPGTMTIGETCLFSFVREGSKGYGYLNGELIAVKDIDNMQGSYAMYMYATAHKQKSIRIYGRSLDQAEIAHNYMIDKARFNLP